MAQSNGKSELYEVMKIASRIKSLASEVFDSQGDDHGTSMKRQMMLREAQKLDVAITRIHDDAQIKASQWGVGSRARAALLIAAGEAKRLHESVQRISREVANREISRESANRAVSTKESLFCNGCTPDSDTEESYDLDKSGFQHYYPTQSDVSHDNQYISQAARSSVSAFHTVRQNRYPDPVQRTSIAHSNDDRDRYQRNSRFDEFAKAFKQQRQYSARFKRPLKETSKAIARDNYDDRDDPDDWYDNQDIGYNDDHSIDQKKNLYSPVPRNGGHNFHNIDSVSAQQSSDNLYLNEATRQILTSDDQPVTKDRVKEMALSIEAKMQANMGIGNHSTATKGIASYNANKTLSSSQEEAKSNWQRTDTSVKSTQSKKPGQFFASTTSSSKCPSSNETITSVYSRSGHVKPTIESTRSSISVSSKRSIGSLNTKDSDGLMIESVSTLRPYGSTAGLSATPSKSLRKKVLKVIAESGDVKRETNVNGNDAQFEPLPFKDNHERWASVDSTEKVIDGTTNRNNDDPIHPTTNETSSLIAEPPPPVDETISLIAEPTPPVDEKIDAQKPPAPIQVVDDVVVVALNHTVPDRSILDTASCLSDDRSVTTSISNLSDSASYSELVKYMSYQDSLERGFEVLLQDSERFRNKYFSPIMEGLDESDSDDSTLEDEREDQLVKSLGKVEIREQNSEGESHKSHSSGNLLRQLSNRSNDSRSRNSRQNKSSSSKATPPDPPVTLDLDNDKVTDHKSLGSKASKKFSKLLRMPTKQEKPAASDNQSLTRNNSNQILIETVSESDI